MLFFSMNINDGPARLFLNENNLEWDKTMIYIIPFDNEKDALSEESRLLDKYKLFSC